MEGESSPVSYMSLDAVRDRVVAMCGHVAGMTVLDAGCGDGLIGRELLHRVGADGSIVFADHDAGAISGLRVQLHDEPRARCVVADASDLHAIETASVDVAVIRAMLLYVPDKAAVLAAVYRVLATGGRLVVSEPVNRYLYSQSGSMWGYDMRPIAPVAEKLRRGFMEDTPPEIQAMTDWTEQDLMSLVVDAGFEGCHMETVTEIPGGRPLPWLAFLHARWTPWMPTVAQVLKQRLTADEAATFEAHVRPLVERGQQQTRVTNLFLAGTRGRAE